MVYIRIRRVQPGGSLLPTRCGGFIDPRMLHLTLGAWTKIGIPIVGIGLSTTAEGYRIWNLFVSPSFAWHSLLEQEPDSAILFSPAPVG